MQANEPELCRVSLPSHLQFRQLSVTVDPLDEPPKRHEETPATANGGQSPDGFLTDGASLTVDAGVVEQLLGLATGRPDGRPAPSPLALELLIAPAAYWAGRAVIEHGRSCRQPRSCPDVPPPLRPLLKMREAAVEARRTTLAQALLRYPDHPMTKHVRERWLEIDQDEPDHGQFVEAIESGAIYTGEGLCDLLGEDPQHNAQHLGTLLWARGLRTPQERAFFELLRLVAHEPPPNTPVDKNPVPNPTRQEKRRERRADQEKIRQLEADLKDARRDRRRQADASQRTEKQLEEMRGQLSDAESELQRLHDDKDRLAGELKTARAELQLAAREAKRASDAATAARESAKQARTAREDVEQARSQVVRELALRRREMEVLRAEMRAIPRGKEAVHEFLQEEERRIDTDLTILQGADRLRAEREHALREKLEDAFKEMYPEFVPPRPVLRAEPASLKLTPLGGADEVGRSAYFLEIGGYSILVDCGIKIGGRHLEDIAPAIERIEHVDAVVLTHAHTDHLGWLPALVNRFRDVDIYCTPETAELVPIMLDDCQRHHVAMMHRLKQHSAYSSIAGEVVDPYEPEDVLAVQDQLVALEFGEVENLPASDLRLTFVRAGHILGAASALIEGEGRRTLMGGDISTEAQLTVGGADWSGLAPVDLLVLESTYGDVPRRPLDGQRRELVSFLSDALNTGGSIILPCFGLGRGQEVELLIERAMEAGELPRVSVWIDGMIRRINRVYERHRPDFSVSRTNFYEVETVHDRFDVIEEARRQPTIIVSTSGMLSGGPAVQYAQALLPDPCNRIVFTGYQDEGNPGYKLTALAQQGFGVRRVELQNEEGEPIEIVAAAPAELFQLSAHADQTGLAASAAAVKPRHIILVHGERSKQEALNGRFASEVPDASVQYGSLSTFAID
jgi:Cft2 family RNA processing exonuclease